MKIIKTHNWNRRDFSATLKCEGCNNVQEEKSCYDDANYYDNVVPNIKCNTCKQSTNSLDLNVDKIVPRYDPNITM